MKPGPKPRRAEDRFWSHVDKNGPVHPVIGTACWLWTAGLMDGYGRFCIGSEQHAHVRAHRFSWELANGPIPDGLNALHSCDNRPCVNPEHLFLGTHGDNVKDKVAKGRAAGRFSRLEFCPQGHPFNAENTYIAPDGKRRCRTCRAEYGARWYRENGERKTA